MVSLLTTLSGVTLFVLSGAIEIEIWHRILLIIIASIVSIDGIGVAVALDATVGTYECSKCHTRFVSTTSDYIAGVHTITKRELKCPNCGEVSCCKKRLTH